MTDSRGRFDKLQFFQDLGYEPHPGQLEIHLDPHPRRVVACGVRWGKTVCAAMEGLAAAAEVRAHFSGALLQHASSCRRFRHGHGQASNQVAVHSG